MILRTFFTASLAILSLAPLLPAKPGTEVIASGLKRPTFLTAPAGSQRFLYILEKEGKIRLFDRKSGKLLPNIFLDLSKAVESSANERGLLGMAFSPNFDSDHRFYLYYSDLKGDTQVSRFTMPDKHALSISPKSEEKLLLVKQDFANHNGGWIGFGPDKMLYIGLGDGGAANDPKQRAQDLSSHLGKLLRIDVSPQQGYRVPKDNPFLNHPSAKAEIFSYGLRNPWRCAWDGDLLYVADVGQNHWEEVNVATTKQLRGANFGWRLREGFQATPAPSVGGEKPAGAIDPIHIYRHGNSKDEGLSVTGGYVYHGQIEGLRGHYFFADYVTGNIWSFQLKDGKPSPITHWTEAFSNKGNTIPQISSFGIDPQGELYIISDQGSIHKVVDKN